MLCLKITTEMVIPQIEREKLHSISTLASLEIVITNSDAYRRQIIIYLMI